MMLVFWINKCQRLCYKKICHEDGTIIREFYIHHSALAPDSKKNPHTFCLISIQKEPRSLLELLMVWAIYSKEREATGGFREWGFQLLCINWKRQFGEEDTEKRKTVLWILFNRYCYNDRNSSCDAAILVKAYWHAGAWKESDPAGGLQEPLAWEPQASSTAKPLLRTRHMRTLAAGWGPCFHARGQQPELLNCNKTPDESPTCLSDLNGALWDFQMNYVFVLIYCHTLEWRKSLLNTSGLWTK